MAGVDASTQACKVVVRDLETGALVRDGRAPHPPGTEVHPERWWEALAGALDKAGGLSDVAAVAVGAQQHGMVCLDAEGEVVRPALLWNDTRSAGAAAQLVGELGGGAVGRRAWAEAVGTVPVASLTVTKLRWLAEVEPANAARTAAVCLPHDWLTWRLRGTDLRGGARRHRVTGIAELTTDRGDASGTGYWSPAEGSYRLDLLELALGHEAALPGVLGPHDSPGRTPEGVCLGPGTGDNAAAALALGLSSGEVVVSIGTSGVVLAVADRPTADPTGAVAGFADAAGRFLPLVCTLNAARVLDAACTLLGVDHEQLSHLALEAPAGAEGLVVVPYLEGERTPDRPFATGAVHGLRLANSRPDCLARAAVEGMLCGLADGLDALVAQGIGVERVVLVGGGSRSEAVRRIAPAVLARPVDAAEEGELVADGAARQAAWVLQGGDEPPAWALVPTRSYEASPTPWVRARYGELREATASVPTTAASPDVPTAPTDSPRR
ncbi:MAG: xylulokinase [Acidimicrobiales bacterium]